MQPMAMIENQSFEHPFSSLAEKCRRSFLRDVNCKVDPVLHSDMGFDVTVVGVDRCLCFCAITSACLYVCRTPSGGGLRSMIRHPWISSRSVIADAGIISISFTASAVKLRFEQWAEFAGVLVSWLRILLPEAHPCRCIYPKDLVLPEIPQKRPHAIDLLLSQFYLSDRRVDEQFLVRVKHDLHRGTASIEVPEALDSNSEAFLAILPFARDIKVVQVGGRGIWGLWMRAGHVVETNQDVAGLIVFDYKKSKDFKTFVRNLGKSKVQSLTFRDIEFNQKQAQQLTAKFSVLPITRLEFDSCQFGPMILPYLSNVPGCLERVKMLRISRDQILGGSVSLLIAVVENTNIESLSIVDSQLDMYQFFDVVEQRGAALKSTTLDLSGNVATIATFSKKRDFPQSLQRLVLQKMTWEALSLVQFLRRYSFNTPIDINLSDAVLTDSHISALIQCFPVDPPSQKVRRIRWDGNAIFSSFFVFVSNLSALECLSISNCTIPRSEKAGIVPAIMAFLEKSTIRQLSVVKTLSPFKWKWLFQMKDLLASHQTLTALDVSSNALGDEGLKLLLEVLRANHRIAWVGFDGLDIGSPREFIPALDEVLGMPNLERVKKPKKEMRRLAEKFGRKVERELNDVWARGASKMHQNKRGPGPNREMDSTDDSTDVSTFGTSDPPVTPKPPAGPLLQASWDVQLDSPFADTEAEWAELERQYSYEKITGVPAPVKPAAATNFMMP
jgi:hypothetical protein